MVSMFLSLESMLFLAFTLGGGLQIVHQVVHLACVGLDQLTKHLINGALGWGETMELIPGLIGLTKIRNTGMAWSLMADSDFRWVLAVVSVAVSIALVVIILAVKMPNWEKFALSLVLGGAVGNAIDRIVLGYVIDMIKTEFISFPIFNVADSFITVGAILFVILYSVRSFKEEKAQKNAEMPELRRLKEKRRGETDDDNGDKM